jgi:peptidoglycan hydrolase-like protein with peptidoglycan-binding domain
MRLLVVAFLAMATAITMNALYFQDAPPRLAASTVGTDAARPHTAPHAETSAPTASGVTAALPGKASQPKPEPSPQPKVEPAPPEPAQAPEQPTPLVRSIQKKLTRFGYKAIPQDGLLGADTRAAILAVEFEQGRPLSGEPSDAILSTLYFLEAAGKSTITTSDRFERDPKLVKEVQDLLARLGYTSGPVDGQLDAKTRGAIKRFEADRHLKGEGRLTERVILEMVIERGKPFLSKG